MGLARLHLIRGERDQARKILKQAEEFHPDDEKVADMLNALDLPRPWDEIMQAPHVQEPVSQDEVDSDENAEPIPTATLAEIYVKQGLNDKAIKIYQEILEQNPQNVSARERLQELQGFSVEAEESVVDQVSDIEEVAQEKATAEPAQPDAPVDRSPLAVMQRWLNVIKQGRANV